LGLTSIAFFIYNEGKTINYFSQSTALRGNSKSLI